ncbi:flavin oxidoreductase, subunit FlxB [Syntrophobacter sp. SbD1]|nr:flavin oxidoreductase, subunit FlxB [Syntrophobacter sp. SbD1]
MAGKIFIALDRLRSTLDKLCSKIDLLAPASSQGNKTGPTAFMPYRSGVVPVLDRQTTLPLKKILLPQAETLLRYEYCKDPQDPLKAALSLDDRSEVRPTLVFGARPCDLKALSTFDRVFTSGPYKDPYYIERRKNTLFATLVCREADGACFCSSVGSGPADMEGSDFRITGIEGGFVVENLTEKAPDLFDSLGEAPTQDQQSEAGRIIEDVSQYRIGTLDLRGNEEAFRKRFEDNEYWQKMAAQCLSCGICTFVCPTCYCFTITDESDNLRGERLRSWDSCMFYHYTLEASGHNPRPTKLNRYRNRVGHKFSYIPEKYDGLLGCSGCGRCIRNCPVSIDIRQAAGQLKENVCDRQ